MVKYYCGDNMNNKGFTLIEALAAVLIVIIISGLVIPTVINQISQKKEDLSDTTKKIIYDATELYMSNNEADYPKLSGNEYCVSLDKLAQAKMIDTPIKDFKTNKEIPLTMYVSVKVNSYGEYDSFKLTKSC